MTYPQTDGTWQQQGHGQPEQYAQQAFAQPQGYSAQPGDYQQSAQAPGYGQQFPGQYAAPVDQAPAYPQPAAPAGFPPAAPAGFPPAAPAGFPPAAPAGFPPAAPAGFPPATPADYQPAAPAGFPSAAPVQPPAAGTPGYYGPAGGVTPAGFVMPGGEAPGIGMVVAITALFGLFGLIPASGRAKKARALGLPTAKYWIAFGATTAANFVVGIFLLIGMLSAMAAGAAAVAAADETATSPKITAGWLEKSIVKDGDFKDEAGDDSKPTSATCAPISVDESGVGAWRCMVDFGKDREGFQVSVGADGRWVTSRGE
jgi:hypothetical protein